MKLLLLILTIILLAGCTSTEYVGDTKVKKIYRYDRSGHAEWVGVEK